MKKTGSPARNFCSHNRASLDASHAPSVIDSLRKSQADGWIDPPYTAFVRRAKPTAALVLVILWTQADFGALTPRRDLSKVHRVRLRYSGLERMTGKDRRALRRAVAELEAMGALSRLRVPGTDNHYVLRDGALDGADPDPVPRPPDDLQDDPQALERVPMVPAAHKGEGQNDPPRTFLGEGHSDPGGEGHSDPGGEGHSHPPKTTQNHPKPKQQGPEPSANDAKTVEHFSFLLSLKEFEQILGEVGTPAGAKPIRPTEVTLHHARQRARELGGVAALRDRLVAMRRAADRLGPSQAAHWHCNMFDPSKRVWSVWAAKVAADAANDTNARMVESVRRADRRRRLKEQAQAKARREQTGSAVDANHVGALLQDFVTRRGGAGLGNNL